MDPARVADLAHRPADRGEVHRSFAEHQVLVNSSNHVFDVNVHDSWSPPLEQGRNVAFVRAVHVADVDRELEEGMIDPIIQRQTGPVYQ